MCRCCYETEGHHAHHEHRHEHKHMRMGFQWPIIDVEEEIKMLEEYKEALTKELEKINRRLEALKH